MQTKTLLLAQPLPGMYQPLCTVPRTGRAGEDMASPHLHFIIFFTPVPPVLVQGENQKPQSTGEAGTWQHLRR